MFREGEPVKIVNHLAGYTSAKAVVDWPYTFLDQTHAVNAQVNNNYEASASVAYIWGDNGQLLCH